MSRTRAEPAPPDVAAIRAIIQNGNLAWGRARVRLDHPTFEAMLTADFHVVLRGQRLGRQEFIERISLGPPGARLTDFDATVLTVQPDGGRWVALIHENIRYVRRRLDGTPYAERVIAITRDGWRQEDGRWKVCFSELVGEQRWDEAIADSEGGLSAPPEREAAPANGKPSPPRSRARRRSSPHAADRAARSGSPAGRPRRRR